MLPGMADTTIRVNTDTRDRLATLAAESGSTIGDLVASLATAVATREEREARHAQVRAYIKQHLCPGITDAELDEGPQLWEDLAAGRVTQLG